MGDRDLSNVFQTDAVIDFVGAELGVNKSSPAMIRT